MIAELLIVFLGFLLLVMLKNCSVILGVSACAITAYTYTYFRLWVLRRDLFDIFLISGFARNFLSFVGKTKSVAFSTVLTWCRIQTSEKTNVPSQTFISSATSRFLAFQYCGDSASLQAEIDLIVLNITERYIHSWYDKISEKKDFVNELNTIIKETFVALCSSVINIDKQKLCYHTLQIYLHYFHHFMEAQNGTRSKVNSENFKMSHWATKDQITEWCYLQNLISRILDAFGPVEYHNSLHSKSSSLLHAMIVEILTENVLYPFLNACTNSSRLNTWLLNFLTNDLDQESEEIKENAENISLIHDIPSFKLFPVFEGAHNVSELEILFPPEDSVGEIPQQTEYSSGLSSFDKTLNIPFTNAWGKSKDEINGVLSQKSETENGDLSQNSETENGDLSQNSEADNELIYEGSVLHLLSGIKSRSNLNLSETEFSNRTIDTTIVYDAPTIKRSKSADFIRQMSDMDGLMPLNAMNNRIKLHGRDNKTFVVFKCDIGAIGDVEEAEEATELELPPLFTDIKITDTLQVENGPVPYTLYCIQYSGIFHDRRKSTNIPELVKHVVCIKRRFREFVALQSRLEDNISLRTFLKGIKGPSKWLATPFSNLDKKNISERKLFLENYLKELCSQDEISRSSELQEFLAYGGDASIAFVKKAADINVPRIDKILFRGMKGAIDVFRSALPNSPDPTINEPHSSLISSNEDNYEFRFHDHSLEYNNRGTEMQEHIKNYLQYFDEYSSSESIYESTKNLEGKLKRPSLMRQMCDLKANDSCKCKNVIDFKSESFSMAGNLFGDVAVDLLMESVSKCVKSHKSFASLSKKIFSPSIDKYVVSKLDDFSEEKLATLLHALHKFLWDGNNAEMKNEPHQATAEDVKCKIKEMLEVYSSSSYLVQILKGNLNKLIEYLLASIQDQQLNRCLIFHIFDAVIDFLCSKETSFVRNF